MAQTRQGGPARVGSSLAAVLGAAALLAGCGRIPLLSEPSPRTILDPEDFAPGVTVEAASAPVRGIEPAAGAGEAGGLPPVLSVTEGPPVLREGPAAPVEEPVLIESKVGDVNGRPIFATEFLEPMAARLAAEAKRMPRQQWVVFANQQIDRGLRDIVTDELLRAEALSRLTAEQKQGLRAILQGMRKDLASGAAGSRALAARRLAEQQGMTEEQYIRAQEQQALITTTLRRDIDNRVNISWRDIEQRYQRDLEVYQPLPKAVFRLIRVPTDSEEAMSTVGECLAAGRPFEEVAAESGSNYKPDEGGLDEVAFEGEYGEASFFGGATLNEKAHGLEPGEWTGPFAMGPYSGWLKLEEIRRESTSLYDAQLPIYQQLLAERRNTELMRYLDRLEARASFTSRDEMRERIFAIADERYGVPEAGGREGP
jgi:hypothetical protein